MTIASAIIQAAFREGNLIPAGKTATADENAEALARLNRFVRSLYGNEIGENLQDWLMPAPQRTAPVAANYPQLPFPLGADASVLSTPLSADPTLLVSPYPPKNSRIVFGATQSASVYFPEAPDDGSRMGIICAPRAQAGVVATLDGNGRTIQGVATVALVAPFAAKQWTYRADLGDWVALAELAAGDEMPFPEEMDDLAITGLIIRLAPGYDKTVSAETATVYKDMKAKFKARYRQSAPTVFGSQDFPRSLQSYAAGRWWY